MYRYRRIFAISGRWFFASNGGRAGRVSVVLGSRVLFGVCRLRGVYTGISKSGRGRNAWRAFKNGNRRFQCLYFSKRGQSHSTWRVTSITSNKNSFVSPSETKFSLDINICEKMKFNFQVLSDSVSWKIESYCTWKRFENSVAKVNGL